MSKLPKKIHSKIYDRLMTPLDEEALELAGWSRSEKVTKERRNASVYFD